MYSILRSAHSGWRYIVLALLLLMFLKALSSWMSNKPFTAGDRKLSLFALIATHIQIVFGLVLYFMSPLVEAGIRYWKMEHISMMIVAAILVTIGNAKSKKAATDKLKHRSLVIFFGTALVIIVVAIMAMVYADPSRTFFGITP